MRYCSECKNEKKESYCDFCKKYTSNKFVIKLSVGAFKVLMPLIKMTHKRFGVKKFLSKVYVGWQETKGRNKIEHPEGVNINRLVDKGHNKYKEIVTDNKTGEIIRNVDESLDQHIPNQQKGDSQL